MITFRQMTLEDLASIKKILTSKYDNFWSYDTLELELKNPYSLFLVALNGTEIIGFGGFRQILDNADIMNIVVRKDMRRVGVGSELLSEILRQAKKKKIVTVSLEVNTKNTPALKLYEKFNFKTINIRKKYYNNIDDALLMYLNI